MTPEKIKVLHRLYGIVTAVLIGIMGICLIVGCLGIYQSGERSFNAEIVGKSLSNLAIPGILCLISILCGVILQIFCPLPEDRPKAIRQKHKAADISPALLRGIRIGCLGAALVLIVLGIGNEGWSDVLNKAIRICQECIGIG